MSAEGDLVIWLPSSSSFSALFVPSCSSLRSHLRRPFSSLFPLLSSVQILRHRFGWPSSYAIVVAGFCARFFSRR